MGTAYVTAAPAGSVSKQKKKVLIRIGSPLTAFKINSRLTPTMKLHDDLRKEIRGRGLSKRRALVKGAKGKKMCLSLQYVVELRRLDHIISWICCSVVWEPNIGIGRLHLPERN